MPEESGPYVYRMLRYCYGLGYSDEAIDEDKDDDGKSQWTSRVLVNTEVFALARRCSMKDLEVEAKLKFTLAIYQEWHSGLRLGQSHALFNSTVESVVEVINLVYSELGGLGE